MPADLAYDYAVIRLVPRVEREEFLNVGVVLSCPERAYLEARIDLDPTRLHAFAPQLDPDLLRTTLAAFPLIAAGGPTSGPIGELPQRQRFHWLVAPRSTILQTSPVHTGRTQDPAACLEHLMATLVQQPRE
ncbi:MAG: DUF3037 domain-containing protein [Chloroflexi bacterium]|nr:DUF3037 domain-containing protein [Chloroflexota bacterium]